jgi:hypothetical protein
MNRKPQMSTVPGLNSKACTYLEKPLEFGAVGMITGVGDVVAASDAEGAAAVSGFADFAGGMNFTRRKLATIRISPR